jgi:hypothetical protein
MILAVYPPPFILATCAHDRAPGPQRIDSEIWIPLPSPNQRVHLSPSSVSLSSLSIVAWFADSLPVRLIPEESLIAFMRDDVVDNGSRGDLSYFLAFGTERMIYEKALPGGSPSCVVPASRC